MKNRSEGKKRGRRRLLVGCGVICLLLGGAAGLKLRSDYKSAFAFLDRVESLVSPVVLDRNDHLLRAFLSKDEKWRLPVKVADIDPKYFDLLMAYEDRRFRQHNGVDMRAILRSTFQLVSNRRVVSGGSTLTMQVARLMSEEGTRSLSGKYHQILRALALESEFSKDEILTLYSMRAPFGGNLEGVRAASLVWFGKEPTRLTLAEAALLVAVPQSPAARRPDRFPENAKAARDRVLDRALQLGTLTEEAVLAAKRERLPKLWRKMPQLAAHRARQALVDQPDQVVHRLTLDRELQTALESLARQQAEKLDRKSSLAILVADHQKGEILAAVGSPNLHDRQRQGHVDMTQAVRSPGSTLKPYIYGVAFEERLAHPESLIVDKPVDFAGYRPTNFEQGFQGAVTVRQALQRSLNTPAVQLLQAVGPAHLLARLKRGGLKPALPGQGAVGLALGLGGVGVRLEDLVRLYAGLAQLGQPIDLSIYNDRNTAAAALPAKRPFLEEGAAWQVLDILSGSEQLHAAETNAIAYKTGTSYGYRDAWSIGVDGRYVVGVWVGRPDGSPVPGQTGAQTATPVLQAAFQLVSPESAPLPLKPDSVIDAVTSDLPMPLQFARTHSADATPETASNLEIVFPPNGATLELGGNQNEQPQNPIILKIEGGKRPFSLLADGRVIDSDQSRFSRQIRYQSSEVGVTSLAIIDSLGNTASVRISIQ
ncbi:penicillin-binding protein 1C [Roseibium sp. TrichSKD4]|uniref:penicillin-binding protein 1C n=1 Tax=Roseibium sp. TrichSKD4 TaxID=744980 RepID=UPI000590627D|nr:penicillin-binding protein 1C [Roseibium sp. TrichSKD4]